MMQWSALLCLGGLVGCASARPYPVSDHFDGDRFFNAARIEPVGPLALARHVLFGRDGAWPDDPLPTETATELPAPGPGKVAVTFVNHATVLLQFDGLTVLTDPVWSARVGPMSWAGPLRARAPGIRFEDLPRVDVVLISHNHYDHLDLPTLRRLQARDDPAVVVPLGDRGWLEAEGFGRVFELDWWQSLVVDARTAITFTPAQHNSGRSPFSSNRSLWGSFWLQRDGLGVYFAGDTAYAGHFRAVRDRLGAPDVALLPIGAYAPRETMRAFHMDPADAVRAQRDLGARVSVGVHYGTFQLTAEDFDQPPRDLAAALAEAPDLPGPFVVLPEGRTRVVSDFPEDR